MQEYKFELAKNFITIATTCGGYVYGGICQKCNYSKNK